jgi:hypothetical protein
MLFWDKQGYILYLAIKKEKKKEGKLRPNDGIFSLDEL